jgi:ribonuclease D
VRIYSRCHTDLGDGNPPALLALHDDYDDDGHCDECGERRPCTVRALVAACVERDALRAEVAEWKHVDYYARQTRANLEAKALRLEADLAEWRDLAESQRDIIVGHVAGEQNIADALLHERAEVTALRAAVARMTGPEAVEAVAQALHDGEVPTCQGGPRWHGEDAAAAVRAIAALGAT